ncbi:hypothetical protein [Variovorax terrae]|uniref:HTH cro/C1-type domain-containing protein n=1 Tax=Variovorax terrae TaxID=2923278 RepID=A0A9X1VUP3_9BURK|nr:hypothetical protein [Variovorax terrae]MCJ0764146.1 hypothetical protein [Variovorax terrae]
MSTHEMASQAESFAERLRMALENKGRKPSPTVLEREFNLRWRGNPVSVHATRKWLLGLSMPTLDKLAILARWLDVSEDWLRWGVAADGAALVAAEPGARRPSAVQTGSRQAQEESSLVQDYWLLTPADRQVVRALLEALLRERRKQAAGSGPA